jgi:hypothetical protein
MCLEYIIRSSSADQKLIRIRSWRQHAVWGIVLGKKEISMKIRITTGIALCSVLLCSRSMVQADAVSDWNAIMLSTIAGQNAPAQARFAAITQLAVFEAVNAITGDYKPYLGTISAPADASPEAAAVAAAYTVLKQYFPAAVSSLDAARAASLAMIPEGPGKSNGLAVGEAAAAAMIALRSNDGASPPEFYLPSSSDPGEWQPTPACSAAGGAFFNWGGVTPFAVRSSRQFRADPPPALSGHRYARAYREVKEVGSINSTERPTGSIERSPILRRRIGYYGMEHGGYADRRGAARFTDGESARSGADKYGH